MRPILKDQLCLPDADRGKCWASPQSRWWLLDVEKSVSVHSQTSRWSWQRWFFAVFVAGGHIQPGQLHSEAARVQMAHVGWTRWTCLQSPVLVNQNLCFSLLRHLSRSLERVRPPERLLTNTNRVSSSKARESKFIHHLLHTFTEAYIKDLWRAFDKDFAKKIKEKFNHFIKTLNLAPNFVFHVSLTSRCPSSVPHHTCFPELEPALHPKLLFVLKKSVLNIQL